MIFSCRFVVFFFWWRKL